MCVTLEQRGVWSQATEVPTMCVTLGKWLGLAESQFSPSGKKKKKDNARQCVGGAFRKIQCMLTAGIPCFSKVCFIPLCFYKGPTLIPVFVNQKKSKEDFCFMGKRWKAKIVFAFANAIMEAVHPEKREWPCQAPSWGPHSASQHQAPELWTVSVSICAFSSFILCIC